MLEASQVEEKLRMYIKAARLTDTELGIRSEVAQPMMSNFRVRAFGLQRAETSFANSRSSRPRPRRKNGGTNPAFRRCGGIGSEWSAEEFF